MQIIKEKIYRYKNRSISLWKMWKKIHKKELKNITIIKTINNDLWSYETLEYFSKLNNINYNKILENDNLLENVIINKYYD